MLDEQFLFMSLDVQALKLKVGVFTNNLRLTNGNLQKRSNSSE